MMNGKQTMDEFGVALSLDDCGGVMITCDTQGYNNVTITIDMLEALEEQARALCAWNTADILGDAAMKLRYLLA